MSEIIRAFSEKKVSGRHL